MADNKNRYWNITKKGNKTLTTKKLNQFWKHYTVVHGFINILRKPNFVKFVDNTIHEFYINANLKLENVTETHECWCSIYYSI